MGLLILITQYLSFLENPNRLMNYISRNVSRMFRQYELGFISYSLRHAWAIRSIHNQIPTSAAARMMGHSVSKHTDTYHFYLNRNDLDKAYVGAVQN